MIGFKRFILLLIFFVLCFLGQFMLFPKVEILLLVPNLLLALTISTGLIFGKAIGLAMGICCGLCMDLLGSGTPGYYLLVFSWVGFLDGIFSKTVETEMLPMLCIFFILNEVAYHLYCYLFGFVLGKSYNIGQFLLKSFLPETFFTLIFFFILHGILGFVTKRLDLGVRQSEVRIV